MIDRYKVPVSWSQEHVLAVEHCVGPYCAELRGHALHRSALVIQNLDVVVIMDGVEGWIG